MQAAAEIGNFRGQTIREWVCWLQRMVSGHAAKARRHHFAEKRTIAKENEMAVTVSVDGEQSSPDAVLMSLEQAALVAEKMETLPEAMQAAIIHRIFFDKPWIEIAELLGKTPEATRVLWTRGLKKLREQLGEV